MMRRILVTGFGPFGGFDLNPSQLLASSCGHPHEILDVSYAHVENWLQNLDSRCFDDLLLIGVSGRAEQPELECIAHNVVGPVPDVTGRVGSGTIDEDGPDRIASTLWNSFSEYP